MLKYANFSIRLAIRTALATKTIRSTVKNSTKLAATALMLFCLTSTSLQAAEVTADCGERNCRTEQDCCVVSNSCTRPADSFWLVSTRHLGCTNGCGDFNLKFARLDDCNSRTCATREEFLSDNSFGRTLFYVHGNRVDTNEAIRRARTLHKEIACKACDAQPIRVVIWSWPSDRVRGLVNDIRTKGERTYSESFYLGRLLRDMPADRPIDFIGYSFGSRVVTGALHLANGGGIRRVAFPAAAAVARGRIVLMAPAIHSDWLLSGRKHERALDSNDGILVLYNSCDPALKRYRFIEKCFNPSALGYAGLANCGTVSPSYSQKNVSHIVGKSHDEFKYLCSPCITSWIADTLFCRGNTAAPIDETTTVETVATAAKQLD